MNELTRYLAMTNKEMMAFIRNFPSKRKLEGNDFVFIEGAKDTPFVLVAHVDTLPRKRVELVQNGVVITNKGGLLGADDRAGVFVALKTYCLADVQPHLLFTDREEVGGIGAKEVAHNMDRPEGVKLLIELDRKGCNEYVTYQDQQQGVHDYVQKFGFREEFGSYSDIADIGPAWNCASVNLSVGYYNQHTEKESLHVDELNLTIDRLLRMMADPITKAYPPPEDMYQGFGFCDRYRPGDWGYSVSSAKKKTKGKGSTLFSTSRKKLSGNCEVCTDEVDKLYDIDGVWVCGKCYDWVLDKNVSIGREW